MSKKSGRPVKGEENNSKQRIIDATVEIIRSQGSESVTVRNVCSKANLSIGTFYHFFKDKDELMMYFLKETSFDSFQLETPLSSIADRISELYMCLIHKYQNLGLDFMKSFYSTNNTSLSAYMGEVNGAFENDTVMARCEKELADARQKGYIQNNVDVHLLSKDICTIVKGCAFEWCLNDGRPDIENILYRIIQNYLSPYISRRD
jgi:AcrR family transcriptional regulator